MKLYLYLSDTAYCLGLTVCVVFHWLFILYRSAFCPRYQSANLSFFFSVVICSCMKPRALNWPPLLSLFICYVCSFDLVRGLLMLHILSSPTHYVGPLGSYSRLGNRCINSIVLSLSLKYDVRRMYLICN